MSLKRFRRSEMTECIGRPPRLGFPSARSRQTIMEPRSHSLRKVFMKVVQQFMKRATMESPGLVSGSRQQKVTTDKLVLCSGCKSIAIIQTWFESFFSEIVSRGSVAHPLVFWDFRIHELVSTRFKRTALHMLPCKTMLLVIYYAHKYKNGRLIKASS